MRPAREPMESPQRAAREAKRAAEAAAKLRKEKWNSVLWLVVAVLVVLGVLVGDYLLRRAAHRQRYHSGRTNAPAARRQP